MSVAIGLCSSAHLHYEAYAAILDGLVGVDFLGLTDDDAERGRTNADALGCPYRDPNDLLAAADGVVVCSTNADHSAWIARAANAGVDVLSEKPLAPSVAAARDTVETAESAGVTLSAAMPLRFSEPLQRAADAYDAGDLGALRAISGTNRGQMPGGWFADPERAGGGAVTDHTPHVVDAVVDLTGERVVEVYAESGTRFNDIGVEDVNVLSMELADGTQFLLDGSWSRPDEWPTWGGATVELLGTDGVVAVDCFGQTLDYAGAHGETDVETVFWGIDANERMLSDFVDAVREGRTPEATGSDAVHVVEVIDAAYESVEMGAPVAVE